MEQKDLGIVGFGLNRKENDFYPTPSYITKSLLIHEVFHGSILEPACGDGAISRILEAEFTDVTSTDIVDRGYGKVKDFFSYNQRFNNIITNPPYNIATEFLIHAKKIALDKIALLLKTTFLEGKKRYPLLISNNFPLKCIYQFTSRVSFDPNMSSGMIAYAWFVWDSNWLGEPVIRWINE